MEHFSPLNADIAEFRIMNGRAGPVAGVANRLVYRFAREPTPAELGALYAQGDAEIAAHDGAALGVLGMGPLPGAIGLPPLAGAPAVPLPGAGLGGGLGGVVAGLAVPLGAAAPGPGAVAAPPPLGVPAGAPGGAFGGPGAAARPRNIPLGGAYVLDEPLGDHDVGEIFGLPVGTQRIGSRALADVGGEVASFTWLEGGVNLEEWTKARVDLLCCDSRLLPARRPGEATRTFTSLVSEMEVITDPGGASPLLGPASSEWFLRSVAGQGSDMESRHHRWVHESGVKPGSMAIHEHAALSKIIQLAVQHDRLNVMNCVSMELALRRLQLHENAISESPEAPSYEGARHFLGTAERRGGALTAPSLTAFVAGELGREAAILKEKRKSREAKAGHARGKAQAAPSGGK